MWRTLVPWCAKDSFEQSTLSGLTVTILTWEEKIKENKGYTFTHPMGTVGFHLEIVLERRLIGTFEADPTAHPV